MTNNSAIIRRANIEDSKAIHEAHMKSIQEVCSKDHTPEEIKAWGDRPYHEGQRQNSIKNDLLWVVEKNGTIEGFGHFKIFEKNQNIVGHIFGLYLTQKVIGQNLGKSIFQLMFIEAKNIKVKEITLEATITAHSFYKKMGFKDIEPQTNIEINGQKIRCYPMKMEIN